MTGDLPSQLWLSCSMSEGGIIRFPSVVSRDFVGLFVLDVVSNFFGGHVLARADHVGSTSDPHAQMDM